MTKQEFLAQLRTKLSALPQDDIEERVIFYSEMIDDRMEEGLSEEEAVAAIAFTEEIPNQAIGDALPSKTISNTSKPKRQLSALTILLIVIGSPIWFSLGIAAASVVFSVYVAIWSVIISLWAVFVSAACCALAGVLSGIGLACNGQMLPGIATIGAGIACSGLAIFIFYGCSASTKGILLLTKKFALWVKSLFIRKEVA